MGIALEGGNGGELNAEGREGGVGGAKRLWEGRVGEHWTRDMLCLPFLSMGTALEEGEGGQLDAGGGGSVKQIVQGRGGSEHYAFTSLHIGAFR